MEQKKILWIVASLGIFLLVIFLGTLIIYSPQKTMQTPMTQTANNTWVNPQAVSPVVTQETQNQTVPQPDMPTTTVETDENVDNVVQSGDLTVISQGKTTVYAQEGITTIDLTQANDVAVETRQAEPAVRPIATRVPSTTKEPLEVTKEAAPVVTKPTAPKTQTTSAVVSKPVNQYWVQAASFVSKPNADNARSALIKQKIPAEVFTHSDEDGVTYYRVRVGPYTTKSEAEYWNTLIQTMDNFSESKSYVTNTSQPAQ